MVFSSFYTDNVSSLVRLEFEHSNDILKLGMVQYKISLHPDLVVSRIQDTQPTPDTEFDTRLKQNIWPNIRLDTENLVKYPGILTGYWT